MAFDGSVVCALNDELNRKITGAGISRIIQPDRFSLELTLKKDRAVHVLYISADPSLPVMYLTPERSRAPVSAPAFCMLLRKHLQGGRIIRTVQPSLERIIDIYIEHYDEMGDLKEKILTVELMGKHSNIIFRDGDKITDSIRHITGLISSVREVLPGRQYFIPLTEGRLNPLEASFDDMSTALSSRMSEPIYKALYLSFTGFSPDLSQEICERAFLDSDLPVCALKREDFQRLFDAFRSICAILKNRDFSPGIVFNGSEPVFFGVFDYKTYKGSVFRPYESISLLLRDYYGKRQSFTIMRQKSSDLRHIVQTILARDSKKYNLQLKQIKDTEKKDRFRVYGELLTAYGYSIEPKATSFSCEDFYTGEQVTIPLDPTLSGIENAKRYFEKYSKLKRTYEALTEVSEQTEEEIDHLSSIMVSLDSAQNETDLEQIRLEMRQAGYIKNRETSKKKAQRPEKSSPLHFISSDGFDIYVGKNNFQNDELSFKSAEPSDWWFHAKKIPGSHVIVKTHGKALPDKTFEEAAALAAYYSASKDSPKVDVDYTLRKNLKKPPASKPGFVIYHTNFSMTVEPGIFAAECEG